MRSLKKSIIGLICAFVLLTIAIIGSFSFTNSSAFAMSDGGKPHLNIRDANDNSAQMPVALPGASGSIVKQIANTGTHSGNLSVSFSAVVNTPGIDGKGDLGANTEIAAYLDVNSNGMWDQGDIGLNAGGTTYNYTAPLSYEPLNNYSGVTWNQAQSLQPAAGSNLVVMWRVPATTENEIQGDAVAFNNTFVLEDQVR
jgi:hypothetical protein